VHTDRTRSTSPVSRSALLDRAVSLATENVAAGGGPFGALVVREDTVVAEGVNRVTEVNDPTAHAEVVAIRRACAELATFSLAGAVLYSSCEPCPMCLAAAMWARVDAVFFAADRFDAARGGFDDRTLWDLFRSPRPVWPRPVRAIPTRHATAPFDAWRDRDGRQPY
jgi:guanine deaminase